MLIATPKETSALEKSSASRTSNPCFRLISNYSFSEFRLSCQTTTYSPGFSSAASKPSIERTMVLAFHPHFHWFETNFMKIEVAYFRAKFSKDFPSQNHNSSAICALMQDCRWEPKGSNNPSTKLPSKPQCYLLHTQFTVLTEGNSAVSQTDYPLCYDGINC